MNHRVDPSVTSEHVIAEADHIVHIEQVHRTGFALHGCCRSMREVLAAIHHDHEVVAAKGPRHSAPTHTSAEDDRHGPTHAATPVIPLAESMAGLNDFRNDS